MSTERDILAEIDNAYLGWGSSLGIGAYCDRNNPGVLLMSLSDAEEYEKARDEANKGLPLADLLGTPLRFAGYDVCPTKSMPDGKFLFLRIVDGKVKS